MKNLLHATLLASFFLLSFTTKVDAQQPEIYSKVRIYATEAQLQNLVLKGLSLDEIREKTPRYVVGEFSPFELRLIREARLKTEVLVADVAADFRRRNKLAAREAQVTAAATTTPAGFNYGSMGGYFTLSEMEKELDSLSAMYPGLITAKVSIGTSLEGRPIWMVKISDSADVDEDEPEVFLNGLIHAREPISMTNLIYFMQYILQNYNTDPELNCLINNREIYVAPCINPDGYVYNEMTNPAGGGTFRKNRRLNSDGTYGVDLNRNFGYKWGLDNSGSSPTPSSDSYRGTAAFSEPETQAIRDFCNAHQFKNVINHHSYANTFNTPWGYVNSATPDNIHYRRWGTMATVVNGYKVGTSYENLGYLVNGGANDWMYGEQTTKNKIFAAVAESGSSSDGFWPVQSRIIPMNEGNLRMNINTCWVTGAYFQPSIPAGTNGGGTSFNLPVTINNYGLQVGTVETVSFLTSDARVTGIGAPVSLQNLVVDGTLNSTINVTFAANSAGGTVNGTLRVTTASGCNLNFPASFEYNGDCAPLPAGWTSGDVGAVGIAGSVCYVSPLFTVKGSGTGMKGSTDQYQLVKTGISGNYTVIARVNSITNTSTGAKAGIVITETTATGSKRVSLTLIPSSGAIEFQSRSKANGNVITTTASGTAPRWLKLTRNSSTFSGYYSSDGVNWTLLKQVNLTLTTTAYAGLAVTSGVNTALSTGVFENVSVSSGVQAASVARVDAKTTGTLEAQLNVYPNPSYRYINVTLPVQGKNADVEIQDINGRVVKRYTNLTSVFQRFDITYLKAGVYIIKVVQDNKVYSKQFVIAQ